MLSKIMYAWSIRRAQGEETNGAMHFIHNKRLLAHEQTVTLDEHHEGRDYPLHKPHKIIVTYCSTRREAQK